MGQCCNSCAHQAQDIHEQEDSSGFINEYGRILFSFLMLVTGIILSKLQITGTDNQYVSLTWYAIAYLPVGLPVMKEAYESIRNKNFFNEFSLMTIASLGAFCIKEYPEGVAVMLFYSIGESFQDKAIDRARRNISKLLDIRPELTMVLRGDKLISENPRNIKVGETIEIKAGERVPLDGMMLSEKALFNTSALTGESVPRVIQKGNDVLAGMIVTDKVMRMKITKPYDESTLARILNMVQNASERKAPTELFIQKFARIYTPVVIALAISIVVFPYIYSLCNTSFGFLFSEWLYRALVFLVVSCPCALVISIPLGYFGGIGAASRSGILFKGGNYLDAIRKINTVVFDKTGTLTKGTFSIQSSKCAEGYTIDKLLSHIASVEVGSTHPIARAIEEYAHNHNVEIPAAKNVTELSGYGLSAEVEGNEVLVGNSKLLAKHHIDHPEEFLATEGTPVLCAVAGKYVGYILLADKLKDDAIDTVKGLKELNIKNIQILSGDRQSIVSNFAEKLGIHHAYGNLLPANKVEHIEELKRKSNTRIAFVGDGMNDAPVLALSDVGIAMGGLGSDAAIETADVVIQNDQPSKVITAINIGKYTHNIVIENITLAFLVKFVVLVLGACGIATLWEAVFADVGVALLAVMNAVRIQRMI